MAASSSGNCRRCHGNTLADKAAATLWGTCSCAAGQVSVPVVGGHTSLPTQACWVVGCCRCKFERGSEDKRCQFYKRAYESLCPPEWVSGQAEQHVDVLLGASTWLLGNRWHQGIITHQPPMNCCFCVWCLPAGGGVGGAARPGPVVWQVLGFATHGQQQLH